MIKLIEIPKYSIGLVLFLLFGIFFLFTVPFNKTTRKIFNEQIMPCLRFKSKS